MNNLVFLFLVIAISTMFCYTILMSQENKISKLVPDPKNINPLSARTNPGNLPLFVQDLSDILRNRELYGGFGNSGQSAAGTGMSGGAYAAGFGGP